MKKVPKYSAFIVDCDGRCVRVGQSGNQFEAIKMALRARRESSGEFPCFVEDGESVVFDRK